jgi:toxin FitB
VLAWNASVSAVDCYVSAVALFELRLGALLKQRRDPEQGERLLRWTTAIRDSFGERVLSLTVDEWTRCAELHVPDPRPLRDSLIAATALCRSLTVVTRNVRDFDVPGLAVLDPWTWESA